jgi:mannose-6-phosphate isomerase-like protein (cupin superfamily)
MSTKNCIKKLNPASEYYFDEGCHIIEMSNSADDPDVSIARARVEPGVTTQWHALDKTVERYVILQGTAVVEVGNAKPAHVEVGDVVLIPSGVRQRITNNSEQDLLFLAICSPRFSVQAYNAL